MEVTQAKSLSLDLHGLPPDAAALPALLNYLLESWF